LAREAKKREADAKKSQAGDAKAAKVEAARVAKEQKEQAKLAEKLKKETEKLSVGRSTLVALSSRRGACALDGQVDAKLSRPTWPQLHNKQSIHRTSFLIGQRAPA